MSERRLGAPALPDTITIREVGPRDGLQPERPVPVADRARLIDALVAAGVGRIEAVAFVSPKAVPAMAGAAGVLAAIDRPPGVTLTALVPNVRGAEMALEVGIDELTVTISVSETYNLRNVRMTVEQSVAAIGEIVGRASEADVPVDAVVSCAFGSPYEGDVPASWVAELAASLVDGGVAALTLADTTGMATPRRIIDVLDAVQRSAAAQVPPALHLHDSRGTALVNAYAGMEVGVDRFDCAIGGLGGSPFAHGAGGNLATESLVALADDLGIRTGIDLGALLVAVAQVEPLIGRPVPAPLVRTGSRETLAAAEEER